MVPGLLSPTPYPREEKEEKIQEVPRKNPKEKKEKRLVDLGLEPNARPADSTRLDLLTWARSLLLRLFSQPSG